MSDTSDLNASECQQWSKLPANGKNCRFSGLSRGSVYRLIGRSEGAIRTVSLRQPGTDRGNRVFNVPDLLAYLARLAAEQTKGGAK